MPLDRPVDLSASRYRVFDPDALRPLLPAGITLLDADRATDPRRLAAALAALRGRAGDPFPPCLGILARPGSAGFTLLHQVAEGEEAAFAGYLSARIRRSGTSIVTDLKVVFTDARFRGRGVAHRLGSALAELSFGVLAAERDREPAWGIPDHYLAWQAVSLGGAAVCERVEDRIRDLVLQDQQHARARTASRDDACFRL